MAGVFIGYRREDAPGHVEVSPAPDAPVVPRTIIIGLPDHR